MLNMDMTQHVVINTGALDWQPSPAHGVLRKPLAREAAEHGHATSIVSYEPGSSFKAHQHPFGEEILVLDGVFSDESGDYQQGCYFRNPPGSSHAPSSAPGCVLFVKLHQFQAEDTAHVCIDTKSADWLPEQEGLEIMPLHRFGTESVALIKCKAGQQFELPETKDGMEIFILSGELIDKENRYGADTWIRSPCSYDHPCHVEQETVIWVKTGHLSN